MFHKLARSNLCGRALPRLAPALSPLSNPLRFASSQKSFDLNTQSAFTIRPTEILHPHIRLSDLLDGKGAEARDGDLVALFDREGQKLGDAFFNSKAQPSLRVVNYGTAPFGDKDFMQSIRRAVELRTRTLQLDRFTNAYRVINSDGDLISGLIVDKYSDTIVVILQNLGIAQRLDRIVPFLHDLLGTKKTIVRLADHEEAKREGIDISALKSDRIKNTEISENGIKYEVNFADGHKSGFFCDQRENRKRFGTLVKKNSNVLDLCSYTGGFALNAKIVGKAMHVTAVDGDEEVVKQAERNGELNGTKIEWVCDDVFRYTREMKKRRRRWDAVVLDPPKLIIPKQEENGMERYQSMNRAALDVVANGGLFVTCSCSGRLPEADFEKIVSQAATEAGVRLQILDKTGAGADHPVMDNCLSSRYLKVIWVRVFRTD